MHSGRVWVGHKPDLARPMDSPNLHAYQGSFGNIILVMLFVFLEICISEKKHIKIRVMLIEFLCKNKNKNKNVECIIKGQ